MGCGASKSLEKRLKEQDQKLEALMQKNDGLQDQIQELKEQRSKRKPVYIINDQEIEDLNIFKTDLDRRFATLQQHIDQLNQEIMENHVDQAVKNSNQPEEDDDEAKWRKMIEGENDFTIKPIDMEINELSNIDIKLDLDEASQKNRPNENI